MAFVKNELPKIAYLISNIIIYVDRQPMHNTTYVCYTATKMSEFFFSL